MTVEGFKRKLTTVFSADVEGYSRLVGEDEAGTAKTLTDNGEIMDELVNQHWGRVVESSGGNVLAGFKSAADAVRRAVEIQGQLKARNAEFPVSRRMEFRIGISPKHIPNAENL
jgi:adenylate cyclase